MLSESPGPVNFTQMVTLFAEKMAGGTDDDDTILKSFDAFEIGGKIDAEMFKHSLMTWGDKFTEQEVDEAFAEFTIADGQIDAVHLKFIFTFYVIYKSNDTISMLNVKQTTKQFISIQKSMATFAHNQRKQNNTKKI